MSKYIVIENGQEVFDIDLDGNETPMVFDSIQDAISEYVKDTDLPAIVWYNGKKIYAHKGIYGSSLYDHTPDDELTQIIIQKINNEST